MESCKCQTGYGRYGYESYRNPVRLYHRESYHVMETITSRMYPEGYRQRKRKQRWVPVGEYCLTCKNPVSFDDQKSRESKESREVAKLDSHPSI